MGSCEPEGAPELGLFRDGKDQGGNGREHGSHCKEDGRGGAEEGIAGLGFLKLHVDNIVLLEIIVGRIDDVRIADIQLVVMLLAFAVLTDQEYLITLGKQRQVTSLSDGLEN